MFEMRIVNLVGLGLRAYDQTKPTCSEQWLRSGTVIGIVDNIPSFNSDDRTVILTCDGIVMYAFSQDIKERSDTLEHSHNV